MPQHLAGVGPGAWRLGDFSSCRGSDSVRRSRAHIPLLILLVSSLLSFTLSQATALHRVEWGFPTASTLNTAGWNPRCPRDHGPSGPGCCGLRGIPRPLPGGLFGVCVRGQGWCPGPRGWPLQGSRTAGCPGLASPPRYCHPAASPGLFPLSTLQEFWGLGRRTGHGSLLEMERKKKQRMTAQHV